VIAPCTSLPRRSRRSSQSPTSFPTSAPIPMLLAASRQSVLDCASGAAGAARVTARRFYYDTVGHGSHAALTCAGRRSARAHPARQRLPGAVVLRDVRAHLSWLREVGLPEADVDQILERTAPSVLHIG